MRLKLITCEVLTHEIEAWGGESPYTIDVVMQPFGLHDTPGDLRKEVQGAIDAVPEGAYDAIILGYGICSNALIGVTARHTQVVLPRAHDCITLFLGSRVRYDEEFRVQPGTYYYSCGWIERREAVRNQDSLRLARDDTVRARYLQYVEKFGEDNARYLIEEEARWLNHYTRAVFINEQIGDIEGYRTFTQNLAAQRGWKYAELPGDNRLLRALFNGDWNAEDFVVLAPGERFVETWDERVVDKEV